jgi:hypothetical protein
VPHIPSFLRLIVVAGLMAWLPAPATAQRGEFLTEIEPASRTFFAGDSISIKLVGGDGVWLAGGLVVEILTDGKVALAYPFVVSAAREVVRNGRRFRTASLTLRVDEQLPPGVYRARGRAGSAVSSLSEPFTIEPWGTPQRGVQASLAAPAVVKLGDPVVVTITLRNAHSTALLVPSNAGAPECATPWLQFVLFPDNSTGRGLRDDRKDCQTQPMLLLQPRETTTLTADLAKLNEHGHEPRSPFRPAPGRLRVHVSVQGTYYTADSGRQRAWKGTALSNPVTIEIK